MSGLTPNLGLYLRGPMSFEQLQEGLANAWDIDLNMTLIDAAVASITGSQWTVGTVEPPPAGAANTFYLNTATLKIWFTADGTHWANVGAISSTPILGTPGLGKVPIGQGNGTAVFADPFVQGVQAEGTDASTVNPVLVGGKDQLGHLRDLNLDNSGNLQALPLPSGASTSAKQDTGNTSLASIDTKTPALSGGKVPVTDPTALPLPSGASTSAKQDTGNTSLASIDTKTPALSGGKVPVTDPTALPLPTGAATETTLAAVNTKLGSSLPLPTGAATSAKQPALGTAGSASTDVITVQGIASGTAQPISAASLPLPAGASTETTLAAAKTDLDTLAGAVSSSKVQTNMAQVAGSTVDTNSGNKSGGTQRVVIATDQPTIQESSSNETSTLYNGTTALTPKFAKISTSSSGASTVVAAVSLKKIRVLRLTFTANAAVNAKFQSHVTPTDLTGLHYLAANGGWVEPYCPLGLFETVAGEALDLNLSSGVAVGGSLTYVEV